SFDADGRRGKLCPHTFPGRSRTLRGNIAGLLVLLACAPSRAATAGADGDWPNVFNDKQGTRYSKLDQINRGNVMQLKVAWVYHTKDAGSFTTIECTPIVVDGTMYVTTVTTKVAAL